MKLHAGSWDGVGTHGAGKIAWFFFLGGGHAAQFQNFRECYPAAAANSAEFFPLRYDDPGDWLSRLPGMPSTFRFGRSLVVQTERALKQSSKWDALFFAGGTPLFVPLFLRYPSYLYVDFTIPGLSELSPWYDEIVHRHPLVFGMRSLTNQLMYRSARGIFAMSAWVGTAIQREFGLPASRVPVVLPGANLKQWHFIDRSKRSRHAPTRILFVGGEFKRKGGELLLEWAERTQETNWEMDIVAWPGGLPDWVLEALGRPGADARVSASLAPRLARVRVHCGLRANTPELVRLYQQADVFCLPTQADSSPIAALEAMACGLPVLVGAVGGIPEMIRDGETGLLMRRGDPGDLATKLDALLQDGSLRHHLGRAGRASCETYFNVERQIAEILTVMDRDREQDGRRTRT